MVDWSYWVLFASWAISFGLSIHWAIKYFQLQKKYQKIKDCYKICDGFIIKGKSWRVGILVGKKTVWADGYYTENEADAFARFLLDRGFKPVTENVIDLIQ